MKSTQRERSALLLCVGAASIAFAWVVWPYVGAIFWGIVLAIIFAPLYQRALRLAQGRRGVAALATIVVAGAAVGIPLALLTAALVRQATGLFADLSTRRIDFAAYGQRIAEALPPWAQTSLDKVGFGDLAAIQERLQAGAATAARLLTTHVFGIGLGAFDFAISLGVMIYLLFYLLRDGASLSSRFEAAIPLASDDRRMLLATFVKVIRATVKGGAAMMAVQGALGGLVLGWLGVEAPVFWGAVFGLLSMLPVVGAGVLWAPIAIYFALTGALWKGVALTIFGVVVLTAVDNLLRPILVGREAKLPDYVVLVSTLGGIASMGLAGVVVGPVIAAIFLAVWTLFSATQVAEPP